MESPRAITKILIPSKRSTLLHRPRLVDFLHEHIERKLFLVSASAGYGKTCLLIDFAHETTLPVCWYSLDSSDGDPKLFLESVIASLRRQFPNFGQRTLDLLSTSSAIRDIEVIVGTLVTEMHESIPRYFVLVLDDYHTVESSDHVNHIVDTLLRLLPDHVHLIIASRTLPSKLTLTRLTARQEIAGLGINDLRFTAAEIQTLIQQSYQITLTDKDSAELAERSEGWITGILLTTHSLWRGLFQDLVRHQIAHSNLFDYLAREVFAQQSIAVQNFLLDTSILDQLSPALCNGLLTIQNATELLSEIEQRNLFITRLEEDETWYRYHHLFQEFLQTRLLESDAQRWYTLHRRAAELLESRGFADQAINHFLKTESLDDAARIIGRIAQDTFEAGHWTMLAKWIGALPQIILENFPDLIVTRAMIFTETGMPDQALEFYSRAMAVFEKQNDAQGIGRTLTRQATTWQSKGQYHQAIEMCQRALALFDLNAQSRIAHAHRIMGSSYGLLGNWEKSIAELENALQSIEQFGQSSEIARLHHDLGVANRAAGNPTAAEEHFQHALDYWRHSKNIVGLVNTLNSIGVGYHRQGNYDKALETLEEARDKAHQCGQLRMEALVLASLGDVYRDKADYARAQDVYQEAFDIARRINEGFLVTYLLYALGENFRLIGNLETANRLLHQAADQAESHHSSYEIGLTLTALGSSSVAQSNPKSAIDYLTQAIELLERGGAKRDSARAHLHLAHAYWMLRKFRLARQHLIITANLGKQLQESQFAMMDANQLRHLIHYAVSKKIGADYFAGILKRIQALQNDSAGTLPIATPEPASPYVEARAFSTAQITVNGKLVTSTDWDSAMAKELFFLLLSRPQGLRKEQIIETLWSDIAPAKANGIFHSTAWRMRRAVLPECLEYENGLYRINPAINVWYDVEQFDQAIRRAQTGQSDEEQLVAYELAFELYQGDYFEDSYGDWCITLRSALQQQYVNALLQLARIYERREQVDKTITICRRVLEQDDYSEDAYRFLMRAQLRSGDRTGALKTYEQCAQTLENEMNIVPSTETQALYDEIVNTKPH